MNNKHKNILLKIGFLTLMVGFAVLLLIAKIKREQTFKSDANIKINHLDGNYLIDEQTILNTIKRKFPINQKIDTRYLENLENFLKINPQVKEAQAFIDNSGKLNVSITQRRPILRVITRDGLNFYIDKEGEKFPTSKLYTVKVPVVTGISTEKNGSVGKIKGKFLLRVLVVQNYIAEDQFLAALFGQMMVKDNGEILLLPRIGDFAIELGDETELTEKFKNLKIFFGEGLKNVGWEKYKNINVKYKGQVICTK